MAALVEAFAEALSRNAQRPFIVEDGRTRSYREIADWADDIASRLFDEGMAGRPVALLLPSGAAYVAAFLGASIAGCTVVPIDPRLVRREVDFLAGHASCNAAICLPDRAIGNLRTIDPFDRREAPVEGTARSSGDAKEATIVLYTSGSTASPKGVVLEQRAIVANARAWCRRYVLVPNDGLLCTLSLFHSFGMTAALVAALLVGARLIIVDDPLPARMADLSAKHRATVVLAVAAVYPWLVRSNGCPEGAFADVRLFLSGACTLPIDVARRFESKFGRPIHQTYGLTEAAPVVTANPISHVRPGTVGLPLDDVEVRIVDDELLVRGPGVMRGYLGDAAATAASIDASGWLMTGDCARIDADGYVTILGRLKDLIIRAGSKIYPEEIEETLREHPDVEDAAVIGIAHEVYEELPVAFVVPRNGSELDVAALREFCRERLALFKVPRAIRVVDALPRNPNGKVLKRELRALASLEGPLPIATPSS